MILIDWFILIGSVVVLLVFVVFPVLYFICFVLWQYLTRYPNWRKRKKK